MKKISFVLFISAVITMNSCTTKQEKIAYPETNKVDQVDDYFGTKVADPYRWLEDDNSEETAEWVIAENKVTYDYLSKIPFRENLREKLTKIWDYPKYSVTFKRKGHYFFYKNDGMQNQSVLYIQDSLGAEPVILLDPNKLSEDGTVALGNTAISNDGKYLAYSTSTSGSDWKDIYVMDIETKEVLDDLVKWMKFSGISWEGDGFYYSRYDEPEEGTELSDKNEFHKVYFHKLGTTQDEDVLIYENKDFPQRNYYVGVTEDERFLMLSEMESSSGNALYVKDLSKENAEFVPIYTNFDKEIHLIDNVDDKLLVMTNISAPNYQLVMIDPENPPEENWQIIIPEKKEVLESAKLAGGKLLITYMKDASNKAFVHKTNGEFIAEVNLPGIGSIGGFSGRKDDNIAFYSFTSFLFPTTIFKYDIENNTSEVFRAPEFDFNADDYTTEQIFYASKDGTKVPMFLTYKKGIEMDGNNPTFLYGYGGFNISLTPSFSVSRLPFLENGGIYVIANLRGGGEYGEDWHDAGKQLNKQNVFDDFIAAAEYLIDNNYTSPEKIAIAGGSNGGLLVGACMTQRPDLFKVALPAVGVMDMLRYHTFTIGWAWAGDYGTSDDSTQFHYLLGYSPIHTLKKGVEYPATMVTTADHDDRVVPAHSFKFAATLQEKHKGENPVLIRIETKAGHGAGKPTSKRIDEACDVWSFTFYNLGMKPTF